jgi:hypothetical protein
VSRQNRERQIVTDLLTESGTRAASLPNPPGAVDGVQETGVPLEDDAGAVREDAPPAA